MPTISEMEMPLQISYTNTNQLVTVVGATVHSNCSTHCVNIVLYCPYVVLFLQINNRYKVCEAATHTHK